MDQSEAQRREPTAEERAEEIVLEAEQSRAHMYDVAGELSSFKEIDLSGQSLFMDKDYQMIDAHVEESLR